MEDLKGGWVICGGHESATFDVYSRKSNVGPLKIGIAFSGRH
jgi:hypothetical protein